MPIGELLSAALGGGMIHGCFVGPQPLRAREDRFAILGDEPRKVFDRLCHSMALRALPEWAEWLGETLKVKVHQRVCRLSL